MNRDGCHRVARMMLALAGAVALAGCRSVGGEGRTVVRPECGSGDMTAVVQTAIDDAFRAGGGTVRLVKGDWRIGGIRVRSNVTLYLESGCKLIGSRRIEDYRILANDRVEPVEPELISDVGWMRSDSQEKDTITRYPGNRWNNALIRFFRAENAALVGEPGSLIFGDNPYDPLGEELYRGPLGINAIDCTNLVFRGYTISDTGNWAHRMCDVKGMRMTGVTCLGGHDAVHFNGCDGVTIEKCTFKTGDDCVAGYDNWDVTVRDCHINSSCSAFRFAGTRVLIENCRIVGPGEWGFRGVLTKEQKAAGAPTPPGSALGRNNMLSFFTYYADGTHPIRDYAGKILVRNCTVENADRFLHYNYDNERWQRGMPMRDITFEGVKAKGIGMPLDVWGQDCRYGFEASCGLKLTMKDCEVMFREPVPEFMRGANVEQIVLDTVRVGNVKGPLFRTWTNVPELKVRNLSGVGEDVVKSDEPWTVKGI